MTGLTLNREQIQQQKKIYTIGVSTRYIYLPIVYMYLNSRPRRQKCSSSGNFYASWNASFGLGTRFSMMVSRKKGGGSLYLIVLS